MKYTPTDEEKKRIVKSVNDKMNRTGCSQNDAISAAMDKFGWGRSTIARWVIDEKKGQIKLDRTAFTDEDKKIVLDFLDAKIKENTEKGMLDAEAPAITAAQKLYGAKGKKRIGRGPTRKTIKKWYKAHKGEPETSSNIIYIDDELEPEEDAVKEIPEILKAREEEAIARAKSSIETNNIDLLERESDLKAKIKELEAQVKRLQEYNEAISEHRFKFRVSGVGTLEYGRAGTNSLFFHDAKGGEVFFGNIQSNTHGHLYRVLVGLRDLDPNADPGHDN